MDSALEILDKSAPWLLPGALDPIDPADPDAKAKQVTLEKYLAEYRASLEEFFKSLPPSLRMKPEFSGLPGNEGNPAPAISTPHSGARRAGYLDEYSNLTLVAAGSITGGNPPVATTSSKIYNWGTLARTSTGIYTIVVGGSVGGVAVAQSQWMLSLVNGATGASIIAVDTSATTKTFTIVDGGGVSDAYNFKFSVFRMPN